LIRSLTDRVEAGPHERGVALILVLWVLALVSALILAFVGGADTGLRIARNDDAIARAQALAESGVTLAVLGLTDPGTATRWQADGSVHRVSYDGGSIEIRTEDENGKIDLNVAPPELFIGLFRALGANDASATAIAAAIINWRSGGGTTPTDAATIPPDAGAAPMPRQFFDVGELAQIPGISRELYQRAAPFLTVYSFSPYINPMTAPAEVLRSLPGVNEAAIESFLASRTGSNGDPATASQVPAAGDIAVAPLSTVMITARAQSASGARFTREAVVSLAASPNAPFTVLAWGQPRSVTVVASNP
jgi:general secretion pathway protein K